MPRSDPLPMTGRGLAPTGASKARTVPADVVRKILPVDGTEALTVPPAALTLTAPVGATATLAPALTTAGVMVMVPTELGAALLRSERSWVLLETVTAGPEQRGLFTTVVALLVTLVAREPRGGS